MCTTRLRATGLPWLGLVFAFLFTPDLSAGNINYNFNPNDGGWTPTTSGSIPAWFWKKSPSSSDGGWQAFSGSNGADTGAYLTSPCLEVSQNSQQDFVKINLSHRFNFPLSSVTSGTADYLGQIQFRILSGTNAGGWRGIPTQFFTGTATHLVPSYPGPLDPPLFGSLLITSATVASGTFPVQAWAQTTTNFLSGFHELSQVTLNWGEFGLAQGTEFQLRFLMAANTASTSGTAINWEINSVNIDGAKECVVPEPGAIALAATGLATGLGWYARRRSRVRRPRAAAVAVIWVGWALVAMPCLPGQAKADIIASYDFTANNGAWTPSQADPTYPAIHSWTWGGGKWSVIADGAINPLFWTGNYLTSPLITLTGTTPVTSMRLSMSHNYSLPMGLTYPSAGGQVAYRLNGSATWVALPLAAFTTGTGSINDLNPVFGPSPLANPPPPARVSQTGFVPPNYVPPTGGFGSLPPLINGGATFTGETPNFTTLNATTWYVPSQAFISSTSAITSIQLRLIEANLGAGCDTDNGWNVRFIELDSPTTEPPVPEPGTIILAATGGAGAIARWLVRRRKQEGSAASTIFPRGRA